jgi:hypothetical protein
METPQTTAHTTPQVVSGARLRQQARPIITNPETNNSYQVGRPSTADMIRTGVLPENFIGQSLRDTHKQSANGEDQTPEDGQIITDGDVLQLDALRRAQVTAALNKGGALRVVDEPQADNECTYDDIPMSDRNYISAWVKGELAGAPVATTSGEVVTAGALSNFSAAGGSDERAGVGDGRALLQREAVNAPPTE